MKFTYYGHSCFALEIKGKHLLFDPFITPNELASSIDITSIPADYIFISHGHEDHLADAQAIAQRTGAQLISNFEIVTWFNKKGLQNTIPMNHGGTLSLDFGKIKYVNAIHSSTLPDGSSGGNPGGFVLETEEGSTYYSGDTALTLDMKLIGDSYDIDFAILCIGDHFTMGCHDAIRAADFVNTEKVIGVHYDTFPPIKLDKEKASDTFHAAGKELLLPAIGETISLS